ncbi:MAG: hypothetical protein Q9157_003499, partial [Trypethelium eluteriae]
SSLNAADSTKLDDLTIEVERLRRANEEVRSERAKLTSQIHELQNQNAQLIEDHTRDVLSIKAKETQLVRARSDAEAAEATVQSQAREIERLKRELSRQVRASSPAPVDVSEQIYHDLGAAAVNGVGGAGVGNGGALRYDSGLGRSSRSYVRSPTGDVGKENLERPLSRTKLSPPGMEQRARKTASGGSGGSLDMLGRKSPSVLSQGSEGSGGVGATGSRSGSQLGGEREGVESWKRAAEVTQNLKARIEMMKKQEQLNDAPIRKLRLSSERINPRGYILSHHDKIRDKLHTTWSQLMDEIALLIPHEKEVAVSKSVLKVAEDVAVFGEGETQDALVKIRYVGHKTSKEPKEAVVTFPLSSGLSQGYELEWVQLTYGTGGSGASANIIPRQDPSPDPTIASIVASAISSASLAPYAKPSQQVEQVLAIGDSFTAGIGSDGERNYYHGSGDCRRFAQAWPVQLTNNPGWTDFNGNLPGLTFGACSGAKMNNQGWGDDNGLNQNQLEQGDPNPNLEYTPIGQPQIAVMTITGNDVGFRDAIVNCVYTPFPNFDCQGTLNNIGNTIASIEFKEELVQTLVNVVAAGRIARGCPTSENFQVYIAGYVGFWNHDDAGCDDVTWSWWSYWWSAYLTRDVRRQMNGLVDQVNGVISNVATELAASGVIYVDGFQGAYGGHRYCEPASQDYLTKPIGAQTWFWHYASGGWTSGDEGHASLPPDAQNISQMILDALIPDPSIQATLSADNPPSNVSPAFQNETTLIQALDQVDNQTGTLGVGVPLSEVTLRSFHPKGTAYGPWSDAFLASIRANRYSVNSAPPPSPSPPSPSPSPPPPPAYATGTCCFHLDEWEDCNPQSDDLYANITLLDNNKATIYQTSTDGAHADWGEPINAGNGSTIQGPLPYPIQIIGEHENDYVQFTYGSASWTSRTDSGPANCANGGWNPRDGPVCGTEFLGQWQPAENQMDCCFPC